MDSSQSMGEGLLDSESIRRPASHSSVRPRSILADSACVTRTRTWTDVFIRRLGLSALVVFAFRTCGMDSVAAKLPNPNLAWPNRMPIRPEGRSRVWPQPCPRRPVGVARYDPIL